MFKLLRYLYFQTTMLFLCSNYYAISMFILQCYLYVHSAMLSLWVYCYFYPWCLPLVLAGWDVGSSRGPGPTSYGFEQNGLSSIRLILLALSLPFWNGKWQQEIVLFFFKKWAIPGLFYRLFSIFSNKHYHFYNGIRCRNSNPQPLECESPLITTRQGLPSKNSLFCQEPMS